MMFNMPMFTPPFYRRYPPPKYPSPKHFPTPTHISSCPPIQKNMQKKEPPKKQECSNENPQVFNFFGITFAFDDILLLCLLFFLYSEGVNDEMLYIVLILLLLG